MGARRVAAALLLVAAAAGTAYAAQDQAAGALPFAELARRASAAWAAGRNDEAQRWFEQGVERDPAWDEGWWYLGSIHYEADRYADARVAFAHVTRLKPEASPAWAMLGLTEYRLGELDAALQHLMRWQTIGPGGDNEISRTAGLHLAMLLVRSGQFDLAMRPLTWLASAHQETPELSLLCGLVIQERALLPAEVPPADRERTVAIGHAAFSALGGRDAEAKSRFEEVIARYPNVRGVRYAYGLVLSRMGSADALPALRREVELFPDDVHAHLQIALELLGRGQAKEALPSAQEAVRLAPDLFAAHLALGRALVETGTLGEGTAHLERAAELAPDVADIYLALARAYALAGRTADVERMRAKMIETERKRQPQLHP
ncbi:MAG TPA: tetratricopeptide repeat protein [Vicinamibacteria bacterium]|nr:tetratricopeptide repeat protein [Vicinamibacteria bacterium]